MITSRGVPAGESQTGLPALASTTLLPPSASANPLGTERCAACSLTPGVSPSASPLAPASLCVLTAWLCRHRRRHGPEPCRLAILPKRQAPISQPARPGGTQQAHTHLCSRFLPFSIINPVSPLSHSRSPALPPPNDPSIRITLRPILPAQARGDPGGTATNTSTHWRFFLPPPLACGTCLPTQVPCLPACLPHLRDQARCSLYRRANRLRFLHTRQRLSNITNRPPFQSPLLHPFPPQLPTLPASPPLSTGKST